MGSKGSVGLAMLVILFVLAAIVGVPFLLMIAWNYVAVNTFHLSFVLDWWSALALLIVLGIIGSALRWGLNR